MRRNLAILGLISLLALSSATRARAGDTVPATDVAARSASLLELIPDAWPALPRVTGYEFNMKNHTSAPGFEGPSETAHVEPSGKRKRWRVVGLIAHNPEQTSFFDGKVKVTTTPDASGAAIEPRKVHIWPAGQVVIFFAILDDPKVPFKAVLLDAHDQVVGSLEKMLPKAVRPSISKYDARFVEEELNNEERVREAFPTYAVNVRVEADGGRPLSRGRVTLHHDQFGMIRIVETDENGRWSGRLLAGAWTAIAFGSATEEAGSQDTTFVRTPRTLYLLKQFELGSVVTATAAVDVQLRADQIARIRVKDESGESLEVLKLTVAPHRIADALKYADVAQRCADAFILDLDMQSKGGQIDMLTNRGTSYDLCAIARVGERMTALLAAPGVNGDGEIPIIFSPSRMARALFDAPTGFGGGRSIEATITLLGVQRQSFAFTATDLETIYFPPLGAPPAQATPAPSGGVNGGPSSAPQVAASQALGGIRIDMTYKTRNGDTIAFVPFRVDGRAGMSFDLTPRPPFNMTVFWKQQAQRGVQLWIGLTDGAGEVAQSIQSDGQVAAYRGNDKVFEQPLTELAFGFPAGLNNINMAEVALDTRLRVGTETLRGRPAMEPVKRFAGHQTWAAAPSVLTEHVDAFLTMVQKSCEAEKRFLGGPANPVGMDFQVFLPPGVGGLGGGGMIALDLAELLRFTHETDMLPYAYCHELGHNVGFGHDPYMLLAPCGVEEGSWGTLGYRMANGRELEDVFRFLAGHRNEDEGTWTLSPHVFAGIRLIYGADVHRKMFDMQRAFEPGLRAAGLSSIERIAVQYSLAVGENMAWIFRAYGWPVMDWRVTWGRQLAATRGADLQALNPETMQAAALRRWWVQGPIGSTAAGGGGGGGEGGKGDEQPWQAVTWPSDFIALDQDTTPPDATLRYRLFTRIAVAQACIANIVAASDVAMEIRVNGHAVARLDSSPQLEQPVHDELMLDHKRAFMVIFEPGENVIEVDASKAPGSRGFLLALATADGKQPLPVRGVEAGPEDVPTLEARALKPREPVWNGGFEDAGGRIALGWTVGPIEGGLKPSLDDAGAGGVTGVSPVTGGKRCLRFEVAGSGSGGVIQRVVVEPGAQYRIRAKIRSDALVGDAYVSLFTGDITGQPITRTGPPQGGIGPQWIELDGKFSAGKRRCVYICCFVKAKSGSVFFDDVELVREK